MQLLPYIALAFAILALAIHLVGIGLALWRCRSRPAPVKASERPPISIVRPLRGVDAGLRETLESTFLIDYPDYEILFCVAHEDDPAIPLVQKLILRHNGIPARLLIGEDRLGANPKLNNMAKGFYGARHPVVVFVDSNVLTPRDYLGQLAQRLGAGAGMVSAPPVGDRPEGFWAHVECAFLNTYQARIQYAVDALGFGFAQGKTLCFRRADLEHGGLERLASEAAEDAAASKMMRAKKRTIRLAGPFSQWVGRRTAQQMWQRQLRWARLRRASFPLLFAPEICAGALPPLVAVLLAAASFGAPLGLTALAFLAVWFAPEILLARLLRWPVSIPALLLRDAMLPALYVAAWLGRDFEWHGHKMEAVRERRAPRKSIPQRLRSLLLSRPI